MRNYAFSSGYDRAALRLGSWPRRLLWIAASWLGLGLDVVRYTRSIVPAQRRRAVGLSGYELPQALAIAYSYAILRWTGFVLTMLAPDVIPERYSTGSALAGWSLDRARRLGRLSGNSAA